MLLSACSAASLEAAEPLAGTAVESVDRWLLLEVTDTWAPKALQSEVLSAAVRKRLGDWLETPRSRLQLIRRPGRSGQRPLFMLVSAGEAKQTSKVELDRYEDLLDLDLDALPTEPSEPLCLVCVHGRRDRCCAVHGSGVYRAIHAQGVEVWQTSHLGGHRFAACALWLPEGLMYGRLRAEHAQELVAARQAGELGELDFFRGRCEFDRPTQAAEIFLRRRLQERRDGALQWLDTRRDSDAGWNVRYLSPVGEQTVGVRLEASGLERPASCGADMEPMSRFVQR